MEVFKGLTSDQIAILRRSSTVREFTPGQVIFRQEDPAYGIFTVLKGKVEIYKKTLRKEVTLALVGPNEVFGEMGIVRDTGTRTACARAMIETLVMEVAGNPITALKQFGDANAATKFLENLIVILGKRLRSKDTSQAAAMITSLEVPIMAGGMEGELADSVSDPHRALEMIEKNLPKGLIARFLHKKTLDVGDFLCKQGDDPDGFYFIQSGNLEVEAVRASGNKSLNTMESPVIAGEVGFFAGEKRSASLWATTPVTYIHFTSREFTKLRKESPEQAFQVLFAAAQLTVALIIARETKKP